MNQPPDPWHWPVNGYGTVNARGTADGANTSNISMEKLLELGKKMKQKNEENASMMVKALNRLILTGTLTLQEFSESLGLTSEVLAPILAREKPFPPWLWEVVKVWVAKQRIDL